MFSASWLRGAALYNQNLDPDEEAKRIKKELFLKSIRTHIDFLDHASINNVSNNNKLQNNSPQHWTPASEDVEMTVETVQEYDNWNRLSSFEDAGHSGVPHTYHFPDTGGLGTKDVNELLGHHQDSTTALAPPVKHGQGNSAVRMYVHKHLICHVVEQVGLIAIISPLFQFLQELICLG